MCRPLLYHDEARVQHDLGCMLCSLFVHAKCAIDIHYAVCRICHLLSCALVGRGGLFERQYIIIDVRDRDLRPPHLSQRSSSGFAWVHNRCHLELRTLNMVHPDSMRPANNESLHAHMARCDTSSD